MPEQKQLPAGSLIPWSPTCLTLTEVVSEYMLLLAGLVGVELIYFRIASKYRIVDKPNSRSSHAVPTIRGGGIVFFIAILAWFVFHGFSLAWFVTGLTVIAIVSFFDDLRSIPAWIRFAAHTIGILLVFSQLQMFDWPTWLLVCAFIVCVGTINAFNFMDGINGITGVYAFVTVCTFLYIDTSIVPFADRALLGYLLCAIVLFLFFNFRARAICFAGDIGSATMAFMLIFLLLQLIDTTASFYWVILFLVFGIDSVATIVYRIARKENIFKPHRTHLYQYMANELGWSHLSVSLLYGLLQLALNISLIISFRRSAFAFAIGTSMLFVAGYLTARIFAVRTIRGRQPRSGAN
jgi:UDP-N-acetylmuramyl pentapeptide phosphotransferase/UDP-N-acetylglucosamine-1-phosphate transferase